MLHVNVTIPKCGLTLFIKAQISYRPMSIFLEIMVIFDGFKENHKTIALLKFHIKQISMTNKCIT